MRPERSESFDGGPEGCDPPHTVACRRRDQARRFHGRLGGLLVALVAWLGATHALGAPVKHRAVIERVEWEMSDAGASVFVVVKGRVDYQSRFAPADPATGLPPRAFVDLHPAQLGAQISREPLIVDDRLVRRIRLGQFDEDTVRVVLDLSRPARLRVEVRERPSRLLLRLARGESDDSLADAAAIQSRSQPEVVPSAVPETEEPAAGATARHEWADEEAVPPRPPPPRIVLEPSRGWDDAAPLPPRDERELAASDEAADRPAPTPGDAARSPPLFFPQQREEPRLAALPEPTLPPPPTARPPIETARPTPMPRPTTALGPTAEPKTVVLDPGHGGKDPGTQGSFGVPEKDVTLALAYLIKDELEQAGGVRVVLTRTDDRYVSLEERTATANAQGAELFVSIHANASPTESLSGVETYTLNNTDDRATIRLAALENGLTLAGATPGEQDLAYILSDLVQTGKEDESLLLARAVQGDLVRYLRGRWKNVSDLGVKKGPFYVLVGAYMPCILVEVGFLTHPIEGARVTTHRYQRDIASGVAQGIQRFLAAPAPGANL